jgi:hypothetical protein
MTTPQMPAAPPAQPWWDHPLKTKTILPFALLVAALMTTSMYFPGWYRFWG